MNSDDFSVPPFLTAGQEVWVKLDPHMWYRCIVTQAFGDGGYVKQERFLEGELLVSRYDMRIQNKKG